MGRVFGEARDFYRLRLIRVDEQGDLDLEWRDDILWRHPAPDIPDETVVFRAEAVSLENEDDVTVVAEFSDYTEAHDWLAQAQADLDEMTRSEFEDIYIAPAREDL